MESNLIGQGIYPMPYAAYLLQVDSSKLRRWVNGYTYRYHDFLKRQPGIRPASLPELENKQALSFLDFIELLFIRTYRDMGVSLQYIREAVEIVTQELQVDHPFASQVFRTDGKHIFARYEEQYGKYQLVKVSGKYKKQIAFPELIEQFFQQIEYDRITERALRYFPMDVEGIVVLDPRISFGKPTIVRRGVPTEVLWDLIEAGDSVESVARWYQLSFDQVKAAKEYEAMLANAA